VGTPVDPVPAVLQAALCAAADSPGYPLTMGTPALRAAASGWLSRRLGAPTDTAVLPTIGSKELVALLPQLLGVRPGDEVCVPALAYPTYAVGAQLVGATVVTRPSARTRVIWLSSPSNPTGEVMAAERLARVVAWGREHGALVVSDECYIELGWDAEPVSVLAPAVSGGSLEGVLAVHSLSKRSNAAGLRLGLVSGDPAVVAALLEVRKHLGLIVPAPVQAAGVAALTDDAHVQGQRRVYAARRARLRQAVRAAGFDVEHSEAGLYLWCTRGEPCWQTVGWLASLGILVAPGEFYGEAGARHVRVALTATDERVQAAVERLALV